MAARPTAGSSELPHAVEPDVRHGPSKPALYAALDLGTNSCRMLIAEPLGGHFRVVDSFSKSVQLGAGLEQSGKLSGSSMGRAIAALQICRKKLKHHKVKKMRLVATEACRRAQNANGFIANIRRQTGLSLKIIQPHEEAGLAVVSCSPLVDPASDQILVVDIGGGSTELVWLDLREVDPGFRRQAVVNLHRGLKNSGQKNTAKVVDWISVPLGVATLKDQFSDVEDDAAQFALMACHFEEHLDTFQPYARLKDGPVSNFQIVGTSGTVTTIAASHLNLRRYDRNRVDGISMSSDQVEKVINGYLEMGPDGRRSDPRIGRDRHELIMSGAAILQTLLRLWPTERLSVADRGLREGLLYAQMSADNALDKTK
jgi:exopolyphosphatase/guanosine-5'-triphosphate,3'-diphosphate pyrophosphatase